MEPATKALRVTPVIGTHAGIFHCDDALACFMLKLLPQYKDAEILRYSCCHFRFCCSPGFLSIILYCHFNFRTRDQTVLDTCDVVVDVGGTYDPEKHRYDHHQR